MRRSVVVALLGAISMLGVAPAAEAKYPASFTRYMRCSGTHGSETEVPEPRATLVAKVENKKVIKVAVTNHCGKPVWASWQHTALLVWSGKTTDLWKDELDPMPRKTAGDQGVFLNAVNSDNLDAACEDPRVTVFEAALPDTHTPYCGAAVKAVRKFKPATPLPAGTPDRILPCGNGKKAKVWFSSIGPEEGTEHVLIGGNNPCKQWVRIHWGNLSVTNEVHSYLWLAPGAQFNWDPMHIRAWEAGTPSNGGWSAGLVDATNVCVNASGDPYVPDRNDEDWGWASYGFTARVYGWKDVREVKDC